MVLQRFFSSISPLVILIITLSVFTVTYAEARAATDNFEPNTSASNVYNNKSMVLGSNIKNLVILVPNEAHEPPGLPKELRVVNQPYLPQNTVANVGTTIVWFPVDMPHNHQVSVTNENSKTIFDTGVIKFDTTSKPLGLNFHFD